MIPGLLEPEPERPAETGSAQSTTGEAPALTSIVPKPGDSPSDAETAAPVAAPVVPGPVRGDRGVVVKALADMPADTILDEAALGGLLQRTKRSIQRAVNRGELPPPVPFLGRSTWTAGAVLAHLKARQEAVLKTAARRDAKRPKQIFEEMT